MHLEHLQNFLNQNEIPKIKGKPKTFLGIAKQPHYENVLSNIYAFYFRVNEVHKFNDLFVRSLLECIAKSKLGKQKKMLQDFYDFDVETEYTTKKGGRIDLLLSNKEQAIIIENKVHHHIKDNDLDDYWNSIKIEPNDVNNKVGVILSLHPISESLYNSFDNSYNYINITHLELLQAVILNSGDYIMDASDKYFFFLKDLVQNITNMSKPLMKQEELDFYFKNQKEINQLVAYKFSARSHIATEIEKAGNDLEDGQFALKLYTPQKNSELSKRVRYFKSPNNDNLMIAVVYDDMLTNKKELYLIVEFKHDLLKNRERYDKIPFNDEEKKVLAKDFYIKKNNSWAHFASKAYPVNDTLLKDISGFILKQLEEDKLLSIYNKLNLFLENEKSEHKSQK